MKKRNYIVICIFLGLCLVWIIALKKSKIDNTEEEIKAEQQKKKL